MKRSQFIKLTASSMVASSFLSFPIIGKASNLVQDSNIRYSKSRFLEGQKYYFPSVSLPKIITNGLAFQLSIHQYSSAEIANPECKALTNYEIDSLRSEGRYSLFRVRRIGDVFQNNDRTSDFVLSEKIKGFFNCNVGIVSIGKYMELNKFENGADVSLLRLDSPSCYLTTACVRYFGLNNNCKELTTLRNFRDDFLSQQPNGAKLVGKYYNQAPKIVNHISTLSTEKQARVYQFIYDELVTTSVQLIEKGNNQLALEYYKQCSEKLNELLMN